MWKQPWSLKEGFFIGLGLIAVGAALQLATGPVAWQIFAWPVNLVMLGLIVALLAAAYVCHDKVYAVRYLMSWRSAVAALAYAVPLTIIMGVTRQVPGNAEPTDALGLSRMLSFWPFVLVYLWVALTVGLVGIRQWTHLSWRRLPAAASHLGLFIVLVSGTLGSADMQRVKMYCEKGQPEWRVIDENNRTVELPLAIQLNRFILEEYPPKFIVVDNQTGQTLMHGGRPLTLTADSTLTRGRLGGWTITVLERRADDVLKVRATDTHTGQAVSEGIVACGNYMMPPQMVALGQRYSLAIPAREPRRYASEVEVMTKSGKHLEATIEVNKPLTVEGWKIYQYSYNTEMGRWSTYSVLELVTDPWLPVVYVGIGLLAVGAIGMFFKKRREED